MSEIKDEISAKMFSNQYIHYVFKFFPEGDRIAKKYDTEFFTHRVNYYDSILADDTKSQDEKFESLTAGFINIITYDYSGKYVIFDESTPLIVLDFADQFKICGEAKTYFQSLPNFFNSLVNDVIEYYNS